LKKSLIETRRINALLQLLQSGIISKEETRKAVEQILY